MQIDMHYYGTYAMARAAGISQEAAQIIATSAQFVDDNAFQNHVNFKDGSRIDKEATAHHTTDFENLDEHDQRHVWVPFHFIPGNVGESYTERLKCRMDSMVVQEMRDHHLAWSRHPFGLQLMGIAAHVYADTFSHYGFSGVSSRGNKVDNTSFRFHEDIEGIDKSTTELLPETYDYITNKANKFFAKQGKHGGLFDNIKSWLGEELSGALGHGSVATFPDRPYLVWSFDYERPDTISGTNCVRNNPATFLAGCHALHNMFTKFIKLQPDNFDNGDGREFGTIRPKVFEILLVQGDKEKRLRAWQEAASAGDIFGKEGELIPEYSGNHWNEQWKQLDGSENFETALDLSVWKFYQAASLHRAYVLRDLLPKHKLIVD